MQENPYYEPPGRKPRITYSRTEIVHLLVSVIVLGALFSFILPGFFTGEARDVSDPVQPFREIAALPIVLPAAFLSVATGFILHELAHKVVAQRYGHWAEFRAAFKNLGFSALLAYFLGVLFAAPGAVMIRGRVTLKENGVISIVGPATNFVIALVAYPLSFGPDLTAPRVIVFTSIALVNAMLAVFNLLPFGPLDGRKVRAWNTWVWLGAFLASLALFVLNFFRISVA